MTTVKNSMSWLDIKVWIEEQRKVLEGSIIDNVYVLDKVIALKLRCLDGVDRILVLEPGKRISFTRRTIKSEEISGKQLMWRRLLRNCRVERVRQREYEREIYIDLRCGSEARILVVELLPRGVALVLDDSGKILLTTESREMKDRVIRPGLQYVPPPSRKPFVEMSIEELLSELSKGKDLVRGLVRGWGLPPELAEEVLHRLGLPFDLSVKNLSQQDIEKIRNAVITFVNEVVQNPRPCIAYSDSNPIGFYPFEPTARSYRLQRFETFDAAIDEYFSHLLEQSVIEQRISQVRSEIEKLRKSVEDIDRRINSVKERIESLRKVIELIETRFYELEEIHRCVQRTIKSLGWSSVPKCSSYITKFDPRRGVYYVSMEGFLLELDARKSFMEIYNELRKELSDLEKDVERAEEERKRLLEKIAELERRIDVERRSLEIKLRRVKEWYEKFHWMITTNGFLVLGGRDASQNISLIRRYLEKRDIVMHADIHGASAVILKTQGKMPTEQDLREAAVLAACYSKAWKAGLASVDVFWVYGDQVSLSAPSGEYLPRGSFMVYGKKNYIRNVALELCIGVELVGDSYRIVVGPEHLVEKRCIAYALLRPGDEDPSRIAKSFVEHLRKHGLEMLAKSIDLNELIARIPGRSKMVKFVAKPLSLGTSDAQSKGSNGSESCHDQRACNGVRRS